MARSMGLWGWPAAAVTLVGYWLAPLAGAQGVIHTLSGSAQGEIFGYSVRDAGDFDNDGYADVLVMSPTWDLSLYQTGYARIHSGKDGSVLRLYSNPGGVTEMIFAYDGDVAGDFNNDGFLDTAISGIDDPHAPPRKGRVFVFSGLDGAVLFTAISPGGDQTFGQSVSRAGDLDQDGYAEFIVGAYDDSTNAPASGRAWIYSGPAGSVYGSVEGQAGDELGRSVRGAGDANGDGVGEIIIGLPSHATVGRAQVYSGANLSVLHVFDGDSLGDWFGTSVSGAGDVNADGREDFIVGAWEDDNNGDVSGSARVFSGLDGSVLYTFDGLYPTEELGFRVSDAGDLNGDGRDDLLTGSIDNYYGKARAWSGADGSLLFTLAGDSPGHWLGATGLSKAGDVNLDGFADVVVGKLGEQPGGRALVVSGTCGSISSFGSGCAGSAGFVPLLAVTGCATPGGTLELQIANGLGGAAALVLASNAEVALPLGFGCTLHVFPLLQVHGVGLDGSGPGGGTFSQAALLPIDLPLGPLTLQAIVLDAGGAKRYSATNGVRVEVE